MKAHDYWIVKQTPFPIIMFVNGINAVEGVSIYQISLCIGIIGIGQLIVEFFIVKWRSQKFVWEFCACAQTSSNRKFLTQKFSSFGNIDEVHRKCKRAMSNTTNITNDTS
jgi:hypothetical protein